MGRSDFVDVTQFIIKLDDWIFFFPSKVEHLWEIQMMLCPTGLGFSVGDETLQ
jgi:hypothetical protein